MQLKDRKSHGVDGIPADSCKALEGWVIQTLIIIFRKVQAGDQLPPDWVNGDVVRICKNNGDGHECENYRPICLKKIIYKIRSVLIARKLSKYYTA